jgi:hypothetical protein
VSQNRPERQPSQGLSTPVMAEVLRLGAESGQGGANDKKEGGGAPVFWRVFGGTLLSIAALVCVTVYQQLTNQIADLRNELGHLNTDLRKDVGRLSETHGDLVKKDEFSGRMRSVWDGIKELQSDRGALAALKERCAALAELHKAGEDERRRLARELQALREHQAGEQGRRELLGELQKLRERLAELEGRQAGPKVTPAVHKKDAKAATFEIPRELRE